MAWVKMCPVECSGMGTIENIDGELVVTEAYLVDQECSASETEMCDSALGDLETEHFMRKKRKELKGDLNWWWHSHVNMPVFWSGTDMEAIQKLGNDGYILATVFNKKAEHRTAFYMGATNFLPVVWCDNLKPKMLCKVDTEALEAEMKAKVKVVDFGRAYKSVAYTPPEYTENTRKVWDKRDFADEDPMEDDTLATTAHDGLLAAAEVIVHRFLWFTSENDEYWDDADLNGQTMEDDLAQYYLAYGTLPRNVDEFKTYVKQYGVTP